MTIDETEGSRAHEEKADAQFAERQRRLERVLHAAPDPLPAALAAANKNRGFDRKFRADAIEAWLEQESQSDPEFAALEFLQELSEKWPQYPSVFVVLALHYKIAGKRAEALAAASRAMALHQTDLHSQRVFMAIRAWIDGNEHEDEEVAAYLKGRFCSSPFEHFETVPGGGIFVCCPSYLPVPIGNLNNDTAEQIWSGEVAVALRESILDGSFRYCSKLHCGSITNRVLPSREEAGRYVDNAANKPGNAVAKPDESGKSHLPTHLVLSHDLSCNLACPSCRKDFYIAKKDEQAKLQEFLDKSIVPLFQNARLLTVTGSGDPFGSNHFRALLKHVDRKKYPHLKVDVHTNGQLFDERAWNDLSLQGAVKSVEISIDAARAETYAIVRRGGDFDRLRKNLKFISGLRKAGDIERLYFSFVVQATNFQEIPEFVSLGEEFEVDNVCFSMIRNWGTFSPEEFATHLIGGKAHPLHQKFLDVLTSPLLKKPFVSCGNLMGY